MSDFFSFIGRMFTNFIFGSIFLIGLVLYGFKAGAVHFIESDIPAAEVTVSEPTFKIDHRVDTISVYAKAGITSEKKITDFGATVRLYDCPTRYTPVDNCDLLGDDEMGFQGETQPGIPFGFAHNFTIRTSVKPEGVYVAKLELTDFQG